jgi:hypothetical protein
VKLVMMGISRSLQVVPAAILCIRVGTPLFYVLFSQVLWKNASELESSMEVSTAT